jgi:hypothetical protein
MPRTITTRRAQSKARDDLGFDVTIRDWRGQRDRVVSAPHPYLRTGRATCKFMSARFFDTHSARAGVDATLPAWRCSVALESLL